MGCRRDGVVPHAMNSFYAVRNNIKGDVRKSWLCVTLR
jgi:hypothetical protein